MEPPAAGGRVGWARLTGTLDPPTPGLTRDSRHEAELGVGGEGLTLPQRAGCQQPLLPAGVVLGTVPALALPRRVPGVSGEGLLEENPVPKYGPALQPLLTAQASRMVTTSPLQKASSPGLGRVCSHLVMH